MTRNPPGGILRATAEFALENAAPANSPDGLLRAVHRAVAELRRGAAVVLAWGSVPLVILAAETASADGLRAFAALAGDAGALVLAPARAAAVLHRLVPLHPPSIEEAPVALRLSAEWRTAEALRSLADPTAAQMLPPGPAMLADAPAGSPAALALAKLARLLPAVLAAPVAAGGMALAHGLDLLSVHGRDVLGYPRAAAAGLHRVAEAAVPLEDAPDARIVAFRAPDAGIEHLAILVGRPEDAATPLVRLHSECFTGDLLGSLRCDCGSQLRGAIQRMAQEGSGLLLYLAQEGRGIGLVNKLRAYAMQDRGLDTLDANRALGWGADERSFLIAATMLDALGIRRLRLLTNNPDKVAALLACGVDVVGRERHVVPPNGVNDRYLATKARRFGHLLG